MCERRKKQKHPTPGDAARTKKRLYSYTRTPTPLPSRARTTQPQSVRPHRSYPRLSTHGPHSNPTRQPYRRSVVAGWTRKRRSLQPPTGAHNRRIECKETFAERSARHHARRPRSRAKTTTKNKSRVPSNQMYQRRDIIFASPHVVYSSKGSFKRLVHMMLLAVPSTQP